MRRSKLLQVIQPAPEPEYVKGYVVAVSSVTFVDGKDVLSIDLFYEGELKGRYFADRKVRNSYVNGQWNTCRLKNVARICEGLDPLSGEYYCYNKTYKWASEEDKKRACDYLGEYSVEYWEDGCDYDKKRQAFSRKQKRIEEMMAEVPTVPEDVERWVEEELFPQHYLFVSKTGGRSDYSCTACGAGSWKKKNWKNGEMTTCPKCGRPVKVRKLLKPKQEHKYVILLQSYGEKWVERQFKAVSTWSANGKRKIRLYEDLRAIIKHGETYGKVWRGLKREADEFAQDFWDKNPINKIFRESYLYPGNLDEVLPCGNLQYSGLKELAAHGCKLNVNAYIVNYHGRRQMEYLVKAGLYRLVTDITNTYGLYGGMPSNMDEKATRLKDVLRLDGNRTNRLKEIDGSLCTLSWLQWQQEQEKKGVLVKITDESLEYLNKHGVTYRDCQDFINELGSVNRMVNYMKKQRVSPGRLIDWWRDYLRMATSEGMDTTDDIVRFPKDLKARHDQLVEIRNERAEKERQEKNREKLREQNAAVEKYLPGMKAYAWKNDKYRIVPAAKVEELEAEGRILHHCVGSSSVYRERMMKGETWILFLRRNAEPEKPYYTIEIDLKTNRILQFYSEYDRQPNKNEIKKVLDKYTHGMKKHCQAAG